VPVAFWTPSITQMIITTQPNGLVAPVHDRMPVILPAEADSIWLDPAISKEHALSLLEPYPATGRWLRTGRSERWSRNW
jgi:putative SOS response-associated peptidase YedK